MIRYLFSIGFLILGMGLPMSAKDITPVLPLPCSKPTKAKDTSVSTSPAKDKSEKPKTTVTTKKDTKSSPTASKALAQKHETSGPISKVPSGSPSTASSSLAKKQQTAAAKAKPSEHLARLTAYWAGEGDYYTGHGLSSTGIRLHDGHCAVDPRIIPYGSEVKISGLGTYLAVDTGSAVISREAAREAGHNAEERNALVIDLFFEHRSDGKKFAANGPKFASISWKTPHTADTEPKDNHSLYAEENLDKPHNKQL